MQMTVPFDLLLIVFYYKFLYVLLLVIGYVGLIKLIHLFKILVLFELQIKHRINKWIPISFNPFLENLNRL